VKRAIVGYRQDDAGDWIAELPCGHSHHVRHERPLNNRPWVLTAEGRASMLGEALDCGPCDRAELPTSWHVVRSTPEFNEHSMPAGLRKSHRVAGDRWGRLAVHAGHMRFTARTEPPIDIVLGPGATQAIPPQVEHEVEPIGPVTFHLDFLAPE